MRVMYLHHSGFAVQTDRHLLVFDCDGTVYPTYPPLTPCEHSLLFVSHAHHDHFCPEVLSLPGEKILSFDIPEKYAGNRMKPGDTLKICGACIHAFGSTDEGVSFLVDVGGKRIFHAGDLNNWHWQEESTKEEIAEAEENYLSILRTIQSHCADKSIALALFPVDPRMGQDSARGAMQFLQMLSPALLIPMHFWDKPQFALDFAKHAPGRIAVLTQPGQTLCLDE